MHDVIIIGDGPGGLSAALFLAKNGLDALVLGQDKTAMHWAYLYNYLGIPEMGGTEFQTIAKAQVRRFGATLRDDARVETVRPTAEGFEVVLEDSATLSARYLVLAEGKGARLATELGLEKGEEGVLVDRHGRTTLPGVYAVGRLTRTVRSQAIISAGEGAAAALDILTIEKGKPFYDFDTPPKTA